MRFIYWLVLVAAALFLANVLTGLIHHLFLPSCTGLASPECSEIDRTQLWLMITGTGIILVPLVAVLIRRLRSSEKNHSGAVGCCPDSLLTQHGGKIEFILTIGIPGLILCLLVWG